MFLYNFHVDRSAHVQMGDADNSVGIAYRWQHGHIDNEELGVWLRQQDSIENVAYESLTIGERRPRVLGSPRGLLVILRGVNKNRGADPSDMIAIRCWLEIDRVISTENRSLNALQTMVSMFESGDAPSSPVEFLVQLVTWIHDEIDDLVNKIEGELALAEEGMAVRSPSDTSALLLSLRSQIASVRRFLAPQRDVMAHLCSQHSGLLNDDRHRQELREESNRISRFLEDLDLAREHASVLQEAFASQLAQIQNSRMYALSIIAAIFLPLSFITGLLGMNVGGMPGMQKENGFLIVSGLMCGSAIILLLWLKLKKWI